MLRPSITVVAALLLREGGRELLIGQRPEGKKRAGQWEFPGGKAEPEETLEQALRRELREELGIEVEVRPPFERVEHRYPDLSVIVHFIPCRMAATAPVERLEHARLEWVEADRLDKFEFVEADRDLVPKIAAALRAGRL